MSPPGAYLMTVFTLVNMAVLSKVTGKDIHTICSCLMRSKSENPSSYEHLELKEKVMSGKP